MENETHVDHERWNNFHFYRTRTIFILLRRHYRSSRSVLANLAICTVFLMIKKIYILKNFRTIAFVFLNCMPLCEGFKASTLLQQNQAKKPNSLLTALLVNSAYFIWTLKLLASMMKMTLYKVRKPKQYDTKNSSSQFKLFVSILRFVFPFLLPY